MKIKNTKKIQKFKGSSFLEFFEEKIIPRVYAEDDYTCKEIYCTYEAWCTRNGKCVDTFEQVELILKAMGMGKKMKCFGKTYYELLTLRDMGELINLARKEDIINNKGTSENAVLIYTGEKYKSNNDALDILMEYCDKKNYYVADILTVDDIRDEVVTQDELEDDRFLMECLICLIENSMVDRIVTLNSKMISIDYDLLEKLINTLKRTHSELEFMEDNS